MNATEPTVDVAAIARAVREYRAAEASLMRAHAELNALLPEGLIVLHKLPGEPDGPRTIYWTYQRYPRSDSFSESSRRGQEEGVRGVIVEAPRPRTEFLPRLQS